MTTATFTPRTTMKLVRNLVAGDIVVAIGEHPMKADTTVTRLSNPAVTKKRSGWFVFFSTRGAFLPTGSDDARVCEVMVAS